MASKENGNGDALALLQKALADAESGAQWPAQFFLAMTRWKNKGNDPRSRYEGLIEAGKIIRDAGIWPTSAAFYFVAFPVLAITKDLGLKYSPPLARLNERMRAVEKSHGIKKGEIRSGKDAPPEWRSLNQKWNAIADKITAVTFRQYGEPEMAEMFANDRHGFDGLMSEGRQWFQRNKRKGNG